MHLTLPAIKAHALSDPDKVLQIRAYATREAPMRLPCPDELYSGPGLHSP